MAQLRRSLRRLPVRWYVPLCLFVLPLAVYGRFVAGDELANADVFLAYRPVHAWLAEGLRQGRLPLWNPYLLGGFPLAFSEYGWFSPLTWLPLLVFGPHAGYYLAVALYAGLAGVATYGLARTWGASPPGAALGAAVFGQSLLVTGGAPLLNQGAAYWALPALLWCVAAHFRGRRLATPAGAAVLALTLLGSHPQQAIIVAAPAGLYALWRAVGTRRPGLLLPLALAGITGAAVSALRFLPTLTLLGASERAGGLSASASALGSVTPQALLAGLTLPSLRLPLGLLEPQWTAYLGPLPLVLTVAALRWRHPRAGKAPGPGPFLAVLGAAGVLLSFGGYAPLYWAISRTPLLSSFREPSRFLLWTVLAVALGAAWGLTALPAHGRVGRWWWVGAVLLALAVAGFGAVQVGMRLAERDVLRVAHLRTLRQSRPPDYPPSFYLEGVDSAWRQALRSTNPLDPGLLIPLGAAAGALWWWRWGRAGPYPAGSALLAAGLPLLLYGQVRLPAIPAAAVREVPASVAVARQGGPTPQSEEPGDPALAPRVLPWLPLATDFEARRHAEAVGADADLVSYRVLKQFLAPNLGITYAVPLVDGYENLMTREQALLMGALGSERAGTGGDGGAADLSQYRLLERRQHQGERWNLLAASGAGTLLSGDRLRPVTWPPSVRYDRAAVPGVGDDVPPLNVYRFAHPLPRAFVATEWTVASSAGDALGRLLVPAPGATRPPGFASQAPPVVIVPPPGEGEPPRPRPVGGPPGSGEDAATATGPYEARILRYDERVVEVETTADDAALLVLLDAQAPGWSATVTGAAVPIYTANVAFRAVPVPAGRHLVRFTYTPPGWAAGLSVSGAGLLVLLAWTGGALWLRRAAAQGR